MLDRNSRKQKPLRTRQHVNESLERAAEPPDLATDDVVDLASENSGPASDPPSFTPTSLPRSEKDDGSTGE